jgi:hypothetical protein
MGAVADLSKVRHRMAFGQIAGGSGGRTGDARTQFIGNCCCPRARAKTWG